MLLKVLFSAAALTVSGVSGTFYSGATEKTLWKGPMDRLVSPARTGRAGWFEGGYFQITYVRDPIVVMNIGNANGVSTGQLGKLLVHHPNGDIVPYGNVVKGGNRPDFWKLQITNDAQFRTIALDGTIGYNSNINNEHHPFWGMIDILGISFEQNPGEVNKTAGRGTYIYYIDNGIIPVQDITTQPLAMIMTDPNLGMNNDYQADVLSQADHGTRMAGIANSAVYGMAQGAGSGMIQIARRWENQGPLFSETDLVRAIAWIFRNPGVNGGRQRIINLSLAFDDSNYSDVLHCAVQWAYYQDAYVIAAVGNGNVERSWNTPYMMGISGYFNNVGNQKCSVTSGVVTYGSVVDLWAPATMTTYAGEAGSSLPSAFTTAAMAYAISYWPNQLKGNPQRGFKYLKDIADTTQLCADDKKVMHSPNAGRKSLSLKRMKGIIPSSGVNQDQPANFCGNIQLQKTVPDWDALIAKANRNRVGRLVGRPTMFVTNCLFCYV